MTLLRCSSALLVLALLGYEPPAPTPAANSQADATDTTGGDPWGAMPTTVEPFYFTEFEEWVGKPLASEQLARLISRPIPDPLKEGRAFVMLYRADCEHCHDMLETWFTESVPAPTVAVEVPDTEPDAALPFPSTLVERRVFPKGPQYVISTPALFAIKDGVVTGFADDPEDVAEVEACLNSNAS